MEFFYSVGTKMLSLFRSPSFLMGGWTASSTVLTKITEGRIKQSFEAGVRNGFMSNRERGSTRYSCWNLVEFLDTFASPYCLLSRHDLKHFLEIRVHVDCLTVRQRSCLVVLQGLFHSAVFFIFPSRLGMQLQATIWPFIGLQDIRKSWLCFMLHAFYS